PLQIHLLQPVPLDKMRFGGPASRPVNTPVRGVDELDDLIEVVLAGELSVLHRYVSITAQRVRSGKCHRAAVRPGARTPGQQSRDGAHHQEPELSTPCGAWQSPHHYQRPYAAPAHYQVAA